MDYLDFDIEIREGDGHIYPVAARSLVGEGQALAAFPFTDAELETYLLRLENAVLRSAGRRGKALSEEERLVQLLGQQLFDFLLAGELRALYYECQREAAHRQQGVRVRLHVQPSQLSVLPWEFLYDPRRGDYLCLDPHTPLVRYLDLAQRIPPLAVTPPLRILGMVASPRDLPALDVEQERRRVERALHHLREQGHVELIWVTGPTWRDLQQIMRPGRGPWHIFHFIGHGGIDPARNEGFVMLADEQGLAQRISALQLGRLLAGQRYSLRLVILNACEGARGSREDVLSSTAATLVRSGLPAVLAMQYAITDAAAVEFARGFYEALVDGLPVDTAVADARNAINLRNESSLEWGTPVLYMRTADGQIFEVVANESPQALPVVENVPPSQPIETLPPKLAATSPTEQPVSASEAATPDMTPKAERPIQHVDKWSKLVQIERPTAREHKWWVIAGGLIGVVILLYLGVIGIQSYQDNQRSMQATATQEVYYAVATARAVAAATQEAIATSIPTPTPIPTITLTSVMFTCISGTYNCSDFTTQLEAQTVYDACLALVGFDVHSLDVDGDGIACEAVEVATLTSELKISFSIGQSVFIVAPGGLNMRGVPSINSEVIYLLSSGVEVIVVGGPVSADGLLWWQVNDDQGHVGWVVERDQQDNMLLSPTDLPTTFTPLPADTPTLQAGATRTNPKDGAVYVWIPPGEFTMGSSDADTSARDNEKPQHTVEVDGFWIMQAEVTNAQYKSCVDDGVCTEPMNNSWKDDTYADHPVINVDWLQAETYAEWVGGRLPTEAEWEKACRGTDGRIYPWGNELPSPDLLNYNGSGKGATVPVGSYPPGANGLYDMTGNVWEWTADWYDENYYANSPSANPKGLESGSWRTSRGGSFANLARHVRCAQRADVYPDVANNFSGFRVVVGPSSGF